MLIQIFNDSRRMAEFRPAGRTVIGRQLPERGEPGPFHLIPSQNSDPARLIVASHDDRGCARRSLQLEPLDRQHVRIQNLTRFAVPVLTTQHESIDPGAAVERKYPFEVSYPSCRVVVTGEEDWDQLDIPTVVPDVLLREKRPLPELSSLANWQQEDLVRWLQTTASVFQSTLSTSDFIPAAAAALVDIVGLDDGRVLLLRDGSWVEAARFPKGDDEIVPSRTVLERVRTEKRTFWKQDEQETSGGSTVLRQLSMVVAAPVLDASGTVIGVLYGDKRIRPGLPARTIGKPEALLVEMLACGVATGLSRQRHEEQANRAEARFAQFFSRDLAERLAADPKLLEGREADVSVLFADVRGFSRISERIGPAETVRWIGDIMTELSQDVLNTQGVLMDYVGDELIAMWGAPTDQPDHADRAVRAAIAMLEVMPGVSERWRQRTGEYCQIGIGVNSGTALVGNIGSQMKFKYGALGSAVNVASRVQGITKYLKRPFLVSGETRNRLGPKFISRRVCKTRAMNIAAPVELYEVERYSMPTRKDFFAASESALEALERGQFAEAARQAGTLLSRHNGDGPLQLILSRAAAMLMDDSGTFDAVWIPPGK